MYKQRIIRKSNEIIYPINYKVPQKEVSDTLLVKFFIYQTIRRWIRVREHHTFLKQQQKEHKDHGSKWQTFNTIKIKGERFKDWRLKNKEKKLTSPGETSIFIMYKILQN